MNKILVLGRLLTNRHIFVGIEVHKTGKVVGNLAISRLFPCPSAMVNPSGANHQSSAGSLRPQTRCEAAPRTGR